MKVKKDKMSNKDSKNVKKKCRLNKSTKISKGIVNKSMPLVKYKNTKNSLISSQLYTINLLRKAQKFKNVGTSNSGHQSCISNESTVENINSDDSKNTSNNEALLIKKKKKKKKRLSKRQADDLNFKNDERIQSKVRNSSNESFGKPENSLLKTLKKQTSKTSNVENHGVIDGSGITKLSLESIASDKTEKKKKKKKLLKNKNLSNGINSDSFDVDHNKSPSVVKLKNKMKPLKKIKLKKKHLDNQPIINTDGITKLTERVSLKSNTRNKIDRKQKKKLLKNKNSSNRINSHSTDLEIHNESTSEYQSSKDDSWFLSNRDADSFVNDEMENERDGMFSINDTCCSPNVDFHQFNSTQVLLATVHPFTLFFIGVLEVKVLMGKIEVLGYTLDCSCDKTTLYSPRVASYLEIKTKENDVLDESTMGEIIKLGISEDYLSHLKIKYNDKLVFLMLNADTSTTSSVVWPRFVEKYSDVVILTRVHMFRSVNKIENLLKCKFLLYTDSVRSFKVMPHWEEIHNSVIESDLSRTMICGGKGVGKSTLLRYLVNKSLSQFEKVVVIDFDPGQPEFTVPGCLSVLVISSPLLGPNFTHMMKPLRCLFYGEIDVTQNLRYYVECVENIMDFCNSQADLKNIPWFINTMGFNKGIGVPLTSSVITKVLPTTVVQIVSPYVKQNFPADLTPEFVNDNILNITRCQGESVKSDHRLFIIPSAVTKTKVDKKRRNVEEWGIAAPRLREIMILSYFGQMLNSKEKDFFGIEPYVVSLDNISIEVMKENLTERATLGAINGQLVALCNNSSDDKSNVCFGFGIVRAVNFETRDLYLLTPLSTNELCQVNSLVKGAVLLPQRLFMNPSNDAVGIVPYVSYTKNILSHTIKTYYKATKNSEEQ